MAPNVGLGTQGPDQRGWDLWITGVVAVLVAALFVAARLATRLQKHNLGLDDLVVTAALVVSGLLSMCACQAVVYGFGQKRDSLAPLARIHARKWFYGAQITYVGTLMLSKMAVVCLYYRTFALPGLISRRICHGVSAFIMASNVAFVLGTAFQCQPISRFWDDSIKGTCTSNVAWWVSYSAIQICTDLVLLALPIHDLLSLRLVRAEKLGLIVVFATGLFVTATSIVRIAAIAYSGPTEEPTQGPIRAAIWSITEANAGIICSCLPILRKSFVRILSPFIFLHYTRARSNHRSYIALPWRRNRQSALTPHSSPKQDVSGLVQVRPEGKPQRGLWPGSVERMVESGGPASWGTEGGMGSQGGILLRSDIIVEGEQDRQREQQGQQQEQEQGRGLGRKSSQDDERTLTAELQSVTVDSVNSVDHDRSSGQSAFMHI